MYFFEILRECDEGALTEEFLKLCTDSPDISHTREAFCGFLENLKTMEPSIDDTARLFFEKLEGLDGVPYDDVSARFEGRDEKYSLIAIPWNEVLGYRADGNDAEKYGREYLTALVLWEMTWLGYDEQTVRKRLDEWDGRE